MMSLYGDYIKEHRGDEIVETADGFATYRFLNDKQVYIVDIYVKPEARQTSAASDMADTIVLAAKLRGCTELLGTVVPSAQGSTISLKVLLGYKMTLQSSSNDLIIFKKDI